MSGEGVRWQPGAIALLGVALLGVTVADFVLVRTSVQLRLLEALVPLVLAVGLVGFAVWLRTSGLPPDGLTRVAAWCGASTIGLTGLGLWAFWVMAAAGLQAQTARFIVITAATFGGLGGAIVGLYDARQRSHRHRADLARAALDASNDGIATFDDQGRFSLANEAFAAMYGFDDPGDLVDEPWEQIVAEEAIEEVQTQIGEEVIETGSWRGEVMAQRRDGSSFPVEMSVSTMAGGSTVAVVRDITDRRERDREIGYQNSLLNAQLEASLDGILILDDDWTVLEYNDRFLEMWGLNEEEVAAPNFDVREAIADRIRDPASLDDRVDAIERDPAAEDRTELHLEDGRIFDRFSAPVKDDESYYGRVFTFRDVTVQWRYERTIESLHQASRELTTATSETALATTVVQIAEGVLGQPLATFWRYHPDEELLSPLAVAGTAATPPDGLAAIGPDTAEMDAFRSGESTVVTRDAERPWLTDAGLGNAILQPVGEHGLLAVGATGTGGFDQFDRQLVELLAGNAAAALDRLERSRALAQSEQRLRTIVENVPVVLFVINDEEIFTLSTGQGLQGIGLEPGEAVGDTVESVFQSSPELVELCRRGLGGESIAETVHFAGRTFEAWLDPVVVDGDVTQVIGTAMDVTARKRYAGAIEALHNATRRMVGAEDVEGVCAVAADTVRDVLGHSLVGVWLVAEREERLQPVAVTEEARERLGSPEPYDRGEGLIWQVLEDDEARVISDVQDTPAPFDTDALVRNEVLVPIGRHGVFVIGAEGADTFDENDVTLIELLAENAAVTIDRTRRQQELERQRDQMEFFNSILRHDVLNGMTVISSRAEFLADRLDGQDREYTETILDWCDDIVQIIGRVRRVLETLTAKEEASLDPIALDEVIEDEVSRIQATYPAVDFSVDVPSGVTVLADELLSDVVSNLITNAVEHNDSEGLAIDVAATVGEDTVRVRVADSGAGIDEDRKDTVFRRGSTGHVKATGSGFGLFFVDSMVGKYGGEVWIEDNDAGGATFVLSLDRAGDATADPAPE